MNWNLRNSVMFIKWNWLLTKNQMLNAKGCTLLFFIETSTKNFGSHFVFSIRFLVTSRPDGKNINSQSNTALLLI